jgi:hypothetical protein
MLQFGDKAAAEKKILVDDGRSKTLVAPNCSGLAAMAFRDRTCAGEPTITAPTFGADGEAQGIVDDGRQAP